MIKRTLSLTLLSTALFSIASVANASITLKVADNHWATHPTVVAMKEMGKALEKETHGEVKIQVFSDSVLGTEKEAIDQMKMGILDIVRASPITLESYNKTYGLLTLPYLFNDREDMYSAMNKIKDELYLETEKNGFRAIAWNEAGSRSFYNSKRPIYTPEDLKGLKIRVPNSRSFIETIQLLGATPTPLPFGEIYTGLQQGIVDGAEGVHTLLTEAKHGEVAKYFSFDEHFMVPDMVVISDRSWKKLTPEQQQIMTSLSEKYTKRVAELEQEKSQRLLDLAKTELHVKFNQVDKKPFKALVEPMYVKARKNPRIAYYLNKIESK
ncbi:TRAP transporter substrate-binding protein [Vibrio sp. MEBiC08052]|uniref:TRAP transporter substrate-binding protein n=1 Tax=Vibrio sp. MEBiC08052 TaxID=1761910 RepID=UPI00074080F4|nr:TRAP transporter substrate-binding protein [Vibrio sp. MEBiC08052]KUI97909.1 hypothetical protein VRK_26100 [Vibrio sp. MEBiC08052]